MGSHMEGAEEDDRGDQVMESVCFPVFICPYELVNVD